MPRWNTQYYDSLRERFSLITKELPNRLDDVINARVAPSIDDIAIGSGKQTRAAVLFFDIRSFSTRTGSEDLAELNKTLHMLDCVIPMVMHVIYDFGGYVEKNTGDGVMGILTGKDDETSLPALEIALTVFYLLNKLINPYLLSHGIPGVDARIGIDVGRLLLARIGTPKGSAKQDRNFLTAIGPTANIACHLQQMAETNQIWVGDIVKTNSPSAWQDWFIDVTPQNDWGWNYTATGNTYRVWHFHAHRPDVEMPSRPSLLSSLFIPKS